MGDNSSVKAGVFKAELGVTGIGENKLFSTKIALPKFSRSPASPKIQNSRLQRHLPP
jgi:hypothetical protein